MWTKTPNAYAPITAGEYLDERLREIGLKKINNAIYSFHKIGDFCTRMYFLFTILFIRIFKRRQDKQEIALMRQYIKKEM